MSRQDGFYWVRTGADWGVAHWAEGNWYVPGDSRDWQDKSFDEIDERRLAQPEEGGYRPLCHSQNRAAE